MINIKYIQKLILSGLSFHAIKRECAAQGIEFDNYTYTAALYEVYKLVKANRKVYNLDESIKKAIYHVLSTHAQSTPKPTARRVAVRLCGNISEYIGTYDNVGRVFYCHTFIFAAKGKYSKFVKLRVWRQKTLPALPAPNPMHCLVAV